MLLKSCPLQRVIMADGLKDPVPAEPVTAQPVAAVTQAEVPPPAVDSSSGSENAVAKVCGCMCDACKP